MSKRDPPPDETVRMSVWIYKGNRRAEAYLYLPAPDAFEHLPPGLLTAFGELELVLTLELHPQRSLARENVVEVMRNLSTRGFHVQLPPVEADAPRRVH